MTVDRPPRLSLVEHVIVDRDGTLNRELESGWMQSFDQWEWETGSLDALERLSRHGIQISVVTNQSGIGRGAVSAAEVEVVHRALTSALRERGVDLVGIFACPHAPDDGCNCRKPKPELVHRALRESGASPKRTVLIGDDQRDLEAGLAAGVRVALVCTGKGSRFKNAVDPDTLVFENLLEAVESIVGSTDDATLRET
jgi:histidinol-phosphate phosphatase family protein